MRRIIGLTLLIKRETADENGKYPSQSEVAKSAGISTRFYGRIERGEVTPSAFTLSKIARAFDMPLSELCTQIESLTPQNN